MEVERILTLSIEESDRLRADRDRLRTLNETLLKKLAASTTNNNSSSTSPQITANAENHTPSSTVTKDLLRDELLNVKSSSKS